MKIRQFFSAYWLELIFLCGFAIIAAIDLVMYVASIDFCVTTIDDYGGDELFAVLVLCNKRLVLSSLILAFALEGAAFFLSKKRSTRIILQFAALAAALGLLHAMVYFIGIIHSYISYINH